MNSITDREVFEQTVGKDETITKETKEELFQLFSQHPFVVEFAGKEGSFFTFSSLNLGKNFKENIAKLDEAWKAYQAYNNGKTYKYVDDVIEGYQPI